MRALIGKIINIEPQPDTPDGMQQAAIAFTATAVLPTRAAAPEWLKDQTLTLTRTARDVREFGRPGDSIILTVDESRMWLAPLVLEPDVTHGALPETVRVRLRWWKDGNPPEARIHGNGREVRVKLARDAFGFAAELPIANFFPAPPPALPAGITASCDKLKAALTALPADRPYAHTHEGPDGATTRIANTWYAADVLCSTRGGALVGLREQGRGHQHFAAPAGLVQVPGEHAGHIDRFVSFWRAPDRLRELAMTCAAATRAEGATRVLLEGIADEGLGLRTTLTCTALDDLPLLLWHRDFHYHPGKKDDSKGKPEKPKMPIDETLLMGAGFRTASAPEGDDIAGTRLLTAHGDRLVARRGVQPGEMIWGRTWKMDAGWAMTEQPVSRAYLLYLFGRETPPEFFSWVGACTMTLEANWPARIGRPGDGYAMRLALAAGECAGASGAGAWVACRAAGRAGGVRVGLIARLAANADTTARVTLGETTLAVALGSTLLPGIGQVAAGVLEFPDATMDTPLDATVGGIAALATGSEIGR